MEFTILDVMVILFFGSVILIGVVSMIVFSIDWSLVHRKKKVEPLLGVVLPKENEDA